MFNIVKTSTVMIALSSTSLFGFFLITNHSSVSSQPSANWFSAPYSGVTIKQEGSNRPYSQLPQINKATSRDKPCANMKLLTRQFLLSKQSVTACFFDSAIGLVSRSSEPYVVNINGYIAGKVSNLPKYSSLYQTPNDLVMLERFSNGIRSYIKLLYNPSLKTTTGIFGSVSDELNYSDSFTISDKNGNSTGAIERVDYSSSGRYMVGMIQNRALFRVDTKTKKILNFGMPIQSSNGWNPLITIDITNDGNYAVASTTAMRGGQWLRVYDLSDCKQTETDYIEDITDKSSLNCSYIDLTDQVKSAIPNFNRLSAARFGNNNTLVFYHVPADPNNELERYVIRAPGTNGGTNSYLGLGDSFASGEGAYIYFRGTDEGESVNNCHLSRGSYPYLVGNELGLDRNNYHSVACSGAVIRNVELASKMVFDISLIKSNRTNQYLGPDLVNNNELANWLPGYKAQEEFLRENTPDAISLSIGGNDVGFGDILTLCIMPDTCYNTHEDRLSLLRQVRRQFEPLAKLYSQIRLSTNDNIKIYIMGYPELSNPYGKCALNVPLNQQELVFGNQLVHQINEVIESAAKKAGVIYIDNEKSMNEQKWCDTNSHNIAINGLSIGNDVIGIIGKESFHPNQAGHRLLKNSLWDQSNQLAREMPAPDDTQKAPENEEGLVFLNRPKTGENIYQNYYDNDMIDDVIYKDGNYEITVGDIRNSFRPGGDVSIAIHSNPVVLANIKANEFGLVNASVNIPSTIETGYHTINIMGKNIDNVDIRFQKIIYVAASKEDKDGDGIIDTNEPCGALNFLASGVDKDQDNKDDACDDLISTAGETFTSDNNQTARPSVLSSTSEYNGDNVTDRSSGGSSSNNRGQFATGNLLASSDEASNESSPSNETGGKVLGSTTSTASGVSSGGLFGWLKKESVSTATKIIITVFGVMTLATTSAWAYRTRKRQQNSCSLYTKA